MKNHTWLGITNERQENVYFLDYELRPLETMTISIWPDTSGYKSLGGVYINREPAEYRGGKECTTYSMGKFPSGRLSHRLYLAYGADPDMTTRRSPRKISIPGRKNGIRYPVIL